MGLFKKKQNDTPRRRLNEDASRSGSSVDNADTFRRNRTITGTTSNYLSSANIQSDLVSPRSHVHHLSMQRRKVSIIFVIVALSITATWLLISSFTADTAASVHDTMISKKIDASRYETVIEKYFEINPIERFSFLLNSDGLSDYVSSELPEVAAVTYGGMASIGSTDYIITMRRPVAGWKIGDKQYYVDSRGIPFEKNYYVEPDVQIVDNSGVSMQDAGTSAIASNRFLSFVGRVLSLSKSSGYTVTQAILPDGKTRELDIKLKDSGFLVKMSIDRPAGEQVEDMSAAVKYFISRGQNPQYIDVRVSGKAFYM